VTDGAGARDEAGLRIALVRLSSLGDVIHALPVAHVLRWRYPRAELTWVAERPEAAILRGHPDLDQVIEVDTRLWRRRLRQLAGVGIVAREVRALGGRLRARRFDVALDLQGLLKSGLITALCRAPIRIGFARGACRERGNVLFTNRRVEPREGVHIVEKNLALLGALGLRREDMGEPVVSIPRDPDAERTVTSYLEGEGVKAGAPLVCLHPGSGGVHKRWGARAYRELGDELALRLGARVVVHWGPGEEPLSRAVGPGVRAPVRIPPPPSVAEMVAWLRRATLVVGGDTGPVHIAAALGVPTLGLYGPTQAWRTGPIGPRVATIQSPTGQMDGVRVDRALAAAEELMR
jgi:lipopolysaccharide heptosyltransferase I